MVAERDSMSAATRTGSDGAALVSVAGLTMRFPVSKNLFRQPSSFIHAVDDVSFALAPGESLGLVGESGCGKTTVGKLLVKLLEPTSGRIRFRFPSLDTTDGRSADAVDPAPSGPPTCAPFAGRRR